MRSRFGLQDRVRRPDEGRTTVWRRLGGRPGRPLPRRGALPLDPVHDQAEVMLQLTGPGRDRAPAESARGALGARGARRVAPRPVWERVLAGERLPEPTGRRFSMPNGFDSMPRAASGCLLACGALRTPLGGGRRRPGRIRSHWAAATAAQTGIEASGQSKLPPGAESKPVGRGERRLRAPAPLTAEETLCSRRERGPARGRP
jgi:hypothetical protein